jgi:hypothetical protein
MAYDDYRFAPQQVSNPWSLQGSPEQFYAPSSSQWGNYRDRAGMGMGAGFGGAMGLTPAGLLSGVGTGLWRDVIEADNPLKALGSGKAWKNIASFGRSGAKDAQARAEQARMEAVANLREKQMGRFGGALAQQGTDVRGDLEGELRKALYAGGEMGDMDKMQNAMTQFQQRAQQYMLGRKRAGQAREVDAMYADQRRQLGRDRRIGAERTQGMSDIAEQYRIGQRNNAFNQARRGMQGSSVDVEQQGELGRGRDRAAGGLQAGLDEKARAFRLGDQQQRNQLMGLIYGDDPNMAAAFSRTLEGVGQQGRLVQEQQAIGKQLSAQRGAAATGYSQALGQGLSAASKPLGYYIDHQGGGA